MIPERIAVLEELERRRWLRTERKLRWMCRDDSKGQPFSDKDFGIEVRFSKEEEDGHFN